MESPTGTLDGQPLRLLDLPHDLQWEGHPSAVAEVLFTAEKLAWSSHLLGKFTERKLRRKYARVNMNKAEEDAIDRIMKSNDQLQFERLEMQRVIKVIRTIYENGINSADTSDLLRLRGSMADMQNMIRQLNKTVRTSTRNITQAMTLLEKALKRQKRYQAAIGQP